MVAGAGLGFGDEEEQGDKGVLAVKGENAAAEAVKLEVEVMAVGSGV